MKMKWQNIRQKSGKPEPWLAKRSEEYRARHRTLPVTSLSSCEAGETLDGANLDGGEAFINPIITH